MGSQSAFEHGREVSVADVVEAIRPQEAGAYDLKTSIGESPGLRRTLSSVRSGTPVRVLGLSQSCPQSQGTPLAVR